MGTGVSKVYEPSWEAGMTGRLCDITHRPKGVPA
jgi:hypothetical protein